MFFPRSGNRSSASYAESVVFFQRGSAVFTIEHVSFSFPVFLSSIVFQYFSFRVISKVTAILIIIPFFSSEKQSKNRVRLPVCLRDSPACLRDWGLRLCVFGTQALFRCSCGTPLTGVRPHQAVFSLRMSFRGGARPFCHLCGKTPSEISLKKALNAGKFCT